MGVVVVPAPFCFKKVCDTISDYFGGPLAENPNFKKVRNTISDYFGGPLAENSDFKKVWDTIYDYFGGPLAENPDFKKVCGTILVVSYLTILFSRKYQILF